MVEPPDQAGQGARLGDPGFGAQVAGRLAGGGGTQHLVAGAFEGVGHHPEHRGLARPGHAHHQLRPSPRGADRLRGSALLVEAERPDQLPRRLPMALSTTALGTAAGASVRASWRPRLSAMARLPGQHGGQGVHPLPGARHADHGHHLGVGQGPVDQPLQQLGVAGRRGAGPGPRPRGGGRRPCAGPARRRGSSTSETSARASLKLRGSASSRQRRPCATDVGQALDWPADLSQFRPPALHQLALGLVALWPCEWCGRPRLGPGRRFRPGAGTRPRSRPPAWSAAP